MTDIGEYSDKDFADIWEQMRAAEQQTDQLEQKLHTIHAKMDSILAELSKPQTGEVPSSELLAEEKQKTNKVSSLKEHD